MILIYIINNGMTRRVDREYNFETWTDLKDEILYKFLTQITQNVPSHYLKYTLPVAYK